MNEHVTPNWWADKIAPESELAEREAEQQAAVDYNNALLGYVPPTPEPIGRPRTEVEAAALTYTAAGGDIRMRALLNGARPYNEMHATGSDVIVKPGHSGAQKVKHS